jgi:hypothetical protein
MNWIDALTFKDK